MASYTDQIPQFNPYIQQLPVEAMAQVGMEKQRRYDEGVQKIQTNLENIAGLDVIRNVDKNYLQSKLNELGTKLKTVAAGDFSNYQLVNSVGGMAKQIGKDASIQNAVSSTAKFRKSLAEKETLTKEGKASANRDYDFKLGVDDWLESDDLNKSYNGQYKAHTDVNKKVFETLKSLNPNIKETDMPYVVSPDGKIKWGEIASTMQKSSTKEITEGQIRTAVNAVLDSNDLDELASQGRYTYRDVNTEDLITTATNSYTETERQYKNKLVALQSQLLSTTDLGQQEELNKAIRYYKSELGDKEENIPSNLANNFKQTLELIPSNPEGAKAQLYTRNWLDQIGNAFSYREIKDQVLTNPAREDFWKVKNFELDQIKERNSQFWKTKEYDIKLRAQNLEEQKFVTEQGTPGTPYWVSSGDQTIDAINGYENYNDYNIGLKTQNEVILNDLVKNDSNINTKADPKNIIKNIENYKLGKYTPKNEIERDRFNKYIENSNTLSTQKAILNKLEDDAYREITGNSSGSYSESLNKQLQKLNGIKVLLPNGSYTSFSPREIHDFIKKEKYKAVGKSSDLQVDIDLENLTPREKLLYSKIQARYGKVGTRSTGNPAIDNILDKVSPIAAQNRALADAVNTKVSLKLAPITGEFVTKQTSLRFKDNTDKGNFVSDLTNVVQADLLQKVGGKKYDPESTLGTLTKESLENVDFQLKSKGDSYFLQVTDKATKTTSEVPVTPEFVARNKNLGSQFLNKNLDLAQSTLRNQGTTNIFGDFAHATYPTGILGGQTATGNRTVTLPVAIDLRNDGGSIFPIFRLQTKTGTINLELSNPTDQDEFRNRYIPSLTDDKIIKLFKTRYPNIEELIQE
jgi:hypothetical protein